MTKSERLTGIVLALLLLLVAAVSYAALREDRRGLLTVSFLDVGQGDAIFIDAPSGRQVLIDGGPADGGVLRRISRAMPWYDRSIDLVIATHPDADHVSGLIDILERYRIGTIVKSSVQGDTKTFAAFNAAVESERAPIVSAIRGRLIDLGGGAYLQLLSPDRPVEGVETNEGCVVARLVFGKTSFMLPCDATRGVEAYLAALDGSALHSDVLKAGHHGSKTASSPLFVGLVAPRYVVYSRGCNNTYGHPHQETIDTFARLQIPTLDTCTEGTITFVSDGESVRQK